MRDLIWRLVPRTVKMRMRPMDRVDALHEFWRQPAPAGNQPEGYVDPIGRSEALLDLIDWLPKTSRILEVGCNVGRNLAYLHDAGWVDVEGIEISAHAVDLLRETYPQLSDAQIHVGSAEELLPRWGDASVDLVFTMAVIEHLHPDSRHVLGEMARVSTYVLAIEPEAHASHRQYPWDVPKEFRRVGLEQVSAVPMTAYPQTDEAVRDYTAWLFSR